MKDWVMVFHYHDFVTSLPPVPAQIKKKVSYLPRLMVFLVKKTLLLYT